ncbi:integrase/recombinase xerD homolog [Mytilus galloprovincialis]|uniref:integrase/recombinase xerD homolog n=1 Tax=Mytilus galloprovincialis TaxID=29158 RepID=UPI003F7CA63E
MVIYEMHVPCIYFFIYYLFEFLHFSDIFSVGRWSSDTLTQHQHLQNLAKCLPEFCLQSRAENTLKKYRYAFNNFCRWCNSFNLNSLPASDYDVSLYLIHLCKKHKSASVVEGAYYAISWSHKLAGFADPCNSFLCTSIKEGVHRSIGHYIVKKKEPITPEILYQIVQKYGNKFSNLNHRRIACMCLTSYAGFLRFSELVNLKRSDIQFYSTYVSLFIEKSKTDQHREGSRVLIAKTSSITCPVSMLHTYLSQANIAIDSNEFIFRAVSFRKKTNTYALRGNVPLSYTRARELLLDALGSLGLEKSNFGLHSLRAGGATAAASAGINDRLFKKHGRWASETAKDGYVQENISEKLTVSKNLGI